MNLNKNCNYILISILFLLIFLINPNEIVACSTFTVTSDLYCWCDGSCETKTATCVHDGNCLYHTEPSSVKVPGTLDGGTANCKNAWGTWYPDCGASGGPGGCTPDGTCACESELPTCPYVNSGNDDYTTTKPVDAEGNTIESPLDACIGNSISCTKKDSCDDDCGTDGPYACYLPETNLSTIPTPTWNKLKIGNRLSGNLSTSSLTPTRVPYPLSSTETTESLTNTITNPDGSRGLRYNFTIGGVLTTQTVNTLTNQPTAASLTQGSAGSITTSYSTLNKCNNNLRTGSQLTTYYKVDNLTTIDHTISSSLTISGYTGDDSTGRGCTASPSYTGKITNNPLKVRIVAKDSDGSSDINGVFLWLVKNGSSIPSSYIDKMYTVGGGATSTDPNLIGIFVGLNDIRTVATIYKSNNSGGTLVNWGSDSGSTSVKNSAGNVLIQEIKVLSRTENALDKTYTFELELTFPESSPLAGNYKFHTTATDKLTFYNSNSVELRTLYHNSNWQWNFDFLNPTITTPTAVPDPGDQRKIQLNWGSNGTGSNVQNTVVNVYKTLDPIYAVTKLLPTPVADINIIKPEDVPPDSIGLISPSITSGWQFVDQTTTKFNINNNSNGVLSEYVTIYDQACNFSSTGGATSFPSTDLDRWIATKGGVFYSDGRIGYIPKEKIGEKYNLGTELITTKYSNHPGTKDWGDLMNPVTVINAMDTNDLENGYKFDFLVTKFEKMKEKVPFGIVTANNLNCNNSSGCVLYLTTPITLGKTDDTTQTYSGKILVYTTENITVGPNLVAQNPAVDGLILLAAKNITVHSSKHSSTVGAVHYDRIDALVISKDQIYIPDGLVADFGIQQDGVLINGSLLAFGATQNPSIYLKRNLGLLNITNPVLIVNYHPKYAKLSELFFGTDTTTYKQEVGFKF